MYDDDPRESPLPRASSLRTRIVVLSVVGLAVFFFLLTTFASLWTDHLWFQSVHYSGVFSRLFWLRTTLFVVFGLVMGGAVAGAMLSAYYWRPPLHVPGMSETGLDRYRDAVTPIRTWLLLGVSAIAGVFAGTSAIGKWRTYLLWQDGVPFHQRDPYFHKDIGFYVFDLPWYQFVVGFCMATVIVAMLAATVVHYLYGGIRLQASDKLTGPAQVQLSVLVGLFVLFKGIDYWLDRFDLVHGQVHSLGSAFTGIGYTDDHVLLSAKSILAGIALICAALFAFNAWRRTWLLPSVGLSLMVVSAVLLGLIWPAIVQGFVVSPSAEKELPYIATNIKQTRLAYGISSRDVTASTYTTPATATTSDAAALDAQVSSLPLVDPDEVKRLFEEGQQVRGYYSVADVLDVDHYDIQGHDRALVLGARELDQSGIDPSDRSWTNLHTVYTHGSGVIAAFANQRDASNTHESPDVQWAQGTSQDYLEQATGPFQDQIYFGEESPSYSVVGSPKGTKPVELDLAGGASDTTTTYTGDGGVKIGSTFRRALYALKFGSANFLLSERVNKDSQILYDRTPRERVAKVAPWLTLDNDVYPVVEGGHLLWVVDGYTTTDRYPGSELDSFKEMTDDSLQQNSALHTVPTDDINYMRNAVKATVDAYTGQVKLYAWDETDPILQTWEKAFPGTVLPKQDIPSGLLPHLRYPEDMFKVQRYQLATYHVTKPSAFLTSSEKWAVPTDPDSAEQHLLPPYRSFIDGATGQPVWSLTSMYTPLKRSNLAALVTVDSDPTSPDYGRLRLLERPDQQTQGPGQVVSAFKTDSSISGALRAFGGSDTGALRGNLIVVPTPDRGLLYLQPVYAEPTTGVSYPVLAYVLVSYGGRVGYGSTLEAAITSALSAQVSTPPTPVPSPSGSPSPSPSGSPSSSPTSSASGSPQQRATDLLSQAQTLFTKAEAAGKRGDFVGRESDLAQAQQKVAEALALLKK